jgi:hypothetical protein
MTKRKRAVRFLWMGLLVLAAAMAACQDQAPETGGIQTEPQLEPGPVSQTGTDAPVANGVNELMMYVDRDIAIAGSELGLSITSNAYQKHINEDGIFLSTDGDDTVSVIDLDSAAIYSLYKAKIGEARDVVENKLRDAFWTPTDELPENTENRGFNYDQHGDGTIDYYCYVYHPGLDDCHWLWIKYNDAGAAEEMILWSRPVPTDFVWFLPDWPEI